MSFPEEIREPQERAGLQTWPEIEIPEWMTIRDKPEIIRDIALAGLLHAGEIMVEVEDPDDGVEYTETGALVEWLKRWNRSKRNIAPSQGGLHARRTFRAITAQKTGEVPEKTKPGRIARLFGRKPKHED